MAISRPGQDKEELERRQYTLTQFGDKPIVPTVTAPTVPTPQTSIFGEPITPGGRIGLSFADKPLSQTPYQDERQYALSRFDASQTTLEQRQYTLPQFGTTSTRRTDQIPFAMMRDAASYTSQSLFGGYDVRTQGFFEGAYDRQGNLINPELKPNMLTPELAQLMWPYAGEAVRVSLGYNPEAPYELLEEVSGRGVAGGGDGGGGARSISGRAPSIGTGVPRFSGWGLTMWRIT